MRVIRVAAIFASVWREGRAGRPCRQRRFGAFGLLCVLALAATVRGGDPITTAPSRRDTCLRVLTLNLMQMSPVASRGQRFATIARFLEESRDAGRSVDVLLLQEGCSGLWVWTADSLRDLRRALPTDGPAYAVCSRPCFGIPVFLQFRVGLLACGKLLYTDARELPCHVGNWLDDFPLPGRRRAVAAGIDHPVGRVNLITTHLASGGRAADRERQARDLLQFVRDVNARHPADLTILGGDLNTWPGTSLYGLIAAEFTDSYLAANPGAPGPTFNLPGNPHCKGYAGAPRRIDFVFFKAEGVEVESSAVVLNRDGWWVSDHCGVLTTFRRRGVGR